MEKEFEYKEEYGWLTNICLNVTDACNLACRYCFVEQHPHYMTLDIAKQAVHFVLDNLEKKNKKFNKNKKAIITFFGGEPTLMWDEIIVPLINYVKENSFPIDFSMTTNGTLLTEERIEFLKANEVGLLLSIDGDRYTQNFNRPCINNKLSSFDLIDKNIPALLKSYPNITFRATIYSETADKTFENYIYAVKKGFANIYMIPDGRHKWTNQQMKNLIIEIEKIYDFLEFCFINNLPVMNFKPMVESYERILRHDTQIINGIMPYENINRSVRRCGLGTTMGSIGYDGSIYGCQEQTSKEENNIFYIGNIASGINKEKHKKLLSTYQDKNTIFCNDKEMCVSCPLRTICTSFVCPSSSFDTYKNLFTNSEIQCIWLQTLFFKSAELMKKMVQTNNKNFKKFLNNIEIYEKVFLT